MAPAAATAALAVQASTAPTVACIMSRPLNAIAVDAINCAIYHLLVVSDPG